MSGLTVARRAGGADVPAMFRIYNASLDDYFNAESIEYFMLQWPNGQFVADSVLGGTVGALSSYILDDGSASLALFAVDPSSRGMGAGTALLDALVRECRMCGVPRIQLEVRTRNERAISFYERRGFRKKGVLQSLYSDGGDAYRMSLTLRRKMPGRGPGGLPHENMLSSRCSVW